jgi:hypothetical protein
MQVFGQQVIPIFLMTLDTSTDFVTSNLFDSFGNDERHSRKNNSIDVTHCGIINHDFSPK